MARTAPALILALGSLLVAATASVAAPAPSDADLRAIQAMPAPTPTETVLWEKRFGQAVDKQARLTLLREAWTKSFDPSLPWWTQTAWRQAWEREYANEARTTLLETAMPNPYQPAPTRAISCLSANGSTDCHE